MANMSRSTSISISAVFRGVGAPGEEGAVAGRTCEALLVRGRAAPSSAEEEAMLAGGGVFVLAGP